MARHAKTQAIIEAARAILADDNPMTLRQLYYRLVSRQVLKNSRGAYQGLSTALVAARKSGEIPWQWIEDRLRVPRHVAMWQGLPDFAEMACVSYRRNVWATQPGLVETWLEKDALSGLFERVLEPYGITLNVGRGFDGWSSIRNAAERYEDGAGVTVLYFGDFDPSGEDMVRSLIERLNWLGSFPNIIKCALTFEDVQRYELPPDVTKASDTRRAKHVAKWGDIAVELDALPAHILRQRLVNEIEARMDLDALAACRAVEESERDRLRNAMQGAA